MIYNSTNLKATRALTLLLVIFAFNLVAGQEEITPNKLSPNLRNQILPTTLLREHFININDKKAVKFQDKKKGVGMLTWFGRDETLDQYQYKKGTAFLVNTVENSYAINPDTGAQEKKVYLMTSYSNDVPVGKHLTPEFTSAFGDKLNDIFLTFDFENPDTENDPSNYNSDKFIAKRVWRVKLEALVQDKDAGIALYEVVSDESAPIQNQWDVQTSELFKNAYALGWSLHPTFKYDDMQNREMDFLPAEDPKNKRYFSISNPNSLKMFSQKSANEATYIPTLAGLNKNFLGVGLKALSIGFAEVIPKVEAPGFRNQALDMFNPSIDNIRKKAIKWVVKGVQNKLKNTVVSKEIDFDFTFPLSASGNPLLNNTQQVIGVMEQGTVVEEDALFSSFSVLGNSWYFNDTNKKGLIDYLDPNTTWISSIPGGYLRELRPPTAPIPDNQLVKNISLNNDLFKQFDQGLRADVFFSYNLKDTESQVDIISERELGNGIKLGPNFTANQIPQGSRVELQLRRNNDLIYNGWIDNGVLPQSNWFNLLKTPFKAAVPNIFGQYEQYSHDDFRKALIKYLTKVKLDGLEAGEVTKLSGFQVKPFSISVTTNSNQAIPIQAIKLPLMMPINAYQLFENNPYSNTWPSNNYRKSFGKESNEIYIESVKFSLKQFVYSESENDCRELDKELGTIKSGDNGGYLNLDNVNYTIDNVVLSENETICQRNKLNIEVTTSSENQSSAKKFRIWIDFFNSLALDGIKGFISNGNLNNYTYNFVEDPIPHPLENLGSGQFFNNRYSFIAKLPRKSQVNFEDTDAPRRTRMRISIGETNAPTLTQTTKFDQGEVEDYSVRLRNASDEDKKDAMSKNAKIIHKARKIVTKRFGQKSPPGQGGTGQGGTGQGGSVGDDAATVNSETTSVLQYQTGANTKYANAFYVKSYGLIDYGTENTTGFVSSPVWNVISNNTIGTVTISGGSSGISDGGGCPLPGGGGDGGDDPLSLINFDNFDPDNPSSWQYWEMFVKALYNIQRINMYINNPEAFPPIFIFDDYDWEVYDMFKDRMNDLIALQQVLEGNFNDPVQVLNYFLQLDSVINYFLGQTNGDKLRAMYDLIANYHCHLNSFGQFNEGLQRAIDMTNNAAKFALDVYGKVFSEPAAERTIVHTLKLGALPTGSNLGVFFHVKGDSNYATTAINSSGQIVHEVKQGSITKTLTSAQSFAEDDVLQISTIFDGENISLKINKNPIQTTLFSTTPINLSYANYTEITNGARLGGYLRGSTNPDYKPFDGYFIEFLYFGETQSDDFLEELADYNPELTTSRNTTNPPKAAIDPEDLNAEQPQELDFALFPNPAKDHVDILVEVQRAGPAMVNIYDMNGRNVLSRTWPKIEAGHHMITLPNLNLTPGNYILKLMAGNVSRSEKLIIKD